MVCRFLLSYPPVKSKCFNMNSIIDLNEGIHMLRDRYYNAEILIMGDFNHRIGEREVEMPNIFDVWGNLNAENYNFTNKARTTVVMQKERN